jgi:hypothetical protein
MFRFIWRPSGRLIFLVSLILIITPLAHADGTGHISIEDLSFLSEEPPPVDQNEDRIEIEYDRLFRLSRSWSFHFHPFFQATTAANEWSTPTIIDPRDLNIEFNRPAGFVRVGYFTLHWEGTDGVNPMDIATMKNLGDPIHPITEASAGVQIGRSGENYDLEAEFIPSETEAQLPGEASAWWPRQVSLPLKSSSISALLPSDPVYQILPREQYQNSLSNNFGGRARVHGDWGDAALAYFQGASDTPALHPTLNGNFVVTTPSQKVLQLYNPIEIVPIDYARQTTAGYVSTTWGQWIFRLSSRYDQPIGNSVYLPGWSQQTVAGVERSFDIANQMVTVIVQGAWTHHSDEANLLSISDLYDQALLLGLRVPFGEDWTLLLSGFRSGHDGSEFAELNISHRFTDSWSGEVFVQVLGGPANSLLGNLSGNDRAGLKITRAF